MSLEREASESGHRKPGRPRKHGNDPLCYYREHYSGLTRGQLHREDGVLYRRLRLDGLLDQVPLMPRREFGDCPLEFYREHYEGLTRKELNAADRTLYRRLCQDGLIMHVPMAKQGRRSKYGDDALAYYEQHHPGVPRSELRTINSGLYWRLQRDGLLDRLV